MLESLRSAQSDSYDFCVLRLVSIEEVDHCSLTTQCLPLTVCDLLWHIPGSSEYPDACFGCLEQTFDLGDSVAGMLSMP